MIVNTFILNCLETLKVYSLDVLIDAFDFSFPDNELSEMHL